MTRLDNVMAKVLIDIPDPTGIGWFAHSGDEVLVVVKMSETSFCKNNKGLTAVVSNFHLRFQRNNER